MRCIICQNNYWQPYLANLVICPNCHFIRAKDKYFKINPKNFYNLNYFSASDYADYSSERIALENNFKDRLKTILSYKTKGKLLEIGCAYGFFLNLAKKAFTVTGIDLNPQVTKIAHQNSTVKVITGDFINAKFLRNSWDVVCMFDTIEHLRYPDKYLSKVYQILKPNGIVAIETGDIGSLLARSQKDKWRLIKPPIHLQYFSKATLESLLKKSGFKILETHRVPFHRTVVQTLFQLTNNRLLLKLSRPLGNFTFPINTYDIIYIIAQKTK